MHEGDFFRERVVGQDHLGLASVERTAHLDDVHLYRLFLRRERLSVPGNQGHIAGLVSVGTQRIGVHRSLVAGDFNEFPRRYIHLLGNVRNKRTRLVV